MVPKYVRGVRKRDWLLMMALHIAPTVQPYLRKMHEHGDTVTASMQRLQLPSRLSCSKLQAIPRRVKRQGW
ncbi:hypothetical protein FXB40_25270 [Bradyrhizobium rifense]|uniref:Uncharacterized protein n=1 Tax=Bradyrhizobium rifense TaxID=515499 RepID=A0A5D3K9T8_9BRAD|nr:hypothetical protein [Bradyrhizobium rifense]TYL92400.1 hypothetical protein FXB40_25270 [Bradyrhizobium rifense]